MEDGKMLLADGFEDAIIGIAEQFGRNEIVAYDYDKCVRILMDRDGMTYEEGVEWMQFNVIGSYLNDCMPCFIHLQDKEEVIDYVEVANDISQAGTGS